MISDRLRNNADRLAGHALRNEPLPPEACGVLAHVLLAYAEQVSLMENTWFAPEAIRDLELYLRATQDAA